jgi:Zn-dependent M16 (insulinase) family peptidase
MENCTVLSKCALKYFRNVDAFEGLTNSIISSLLVDGPTSPFYQALIEPNIGSDYSPATG